MSFRIATSLAARRLAAVSIQRRTAIVVPKLGTDAEMQAQSIEQIRARVEYQKKLIAAQEHGHDDLDEMWRWINLTFFVGIPVVIVSGLFTLIFDEHAHRIDGELPEYMKIRSKEFPWQCSDCDIFDGACWEKCRAEKSG